jgi:DNA repair photolyase
MYFDWTINPYRGCEFGCKYCYARYTHEFMELREPLDFETRIFVKQFSPPSFRHELAGIPLRDHIAIGTATDPYQPAERRYRLTRSILEVLASERGRRISVTTKSDLVSRDADLLARIGRSNVLHINLTITTMDARLARLIEPRAPRPDLRIRALAALSGRGVAAGVFACPVLPEINDSYRSLHEVARAASQAGAKYFGAGILFLKPCAGRVFLPFLEQEFPHLAARYKSSYAESAFLKGEYPKLVEDRAEAIRKLFRLEKRPATYQPEDGSDPQLSLFSPLTNL